MPLTLKERVLKAREELKEIGVKMPRYYFTLKFPKYSNEPDRLDNLYYVKIEEEQFTKELESFVQYKKTELNNNK